MKQYEHSQETKQRILQSAVEGFSREGYNSTGVAQICSRAGVSKGAFYHHFPSKQAVFVLLLEEWLAGLDKRLEETSAPAASIPEALMKMTEAIPYVFTSAQDQLHLFLEFWTQASRDPDIWKAAIAPYRKYHRYFAGLLQRAVKEGTLPACDPDTTARIIVAFAMGILLQGVMDPSGADWEKISKQGMGMLLRGLSEEVS